MRPSALVFPVLASMLACSSTESAPHRAVELEAALGFRAPEERVA